MTSVRITATEEGTSVTVNGQTVEAEWVYVSAGRFRSGRRFCTVGLMTAESPPGNGWGRPHVGSLWWEIEPTRLEISAVTEPQ